MQQQTSSPPPSSSSSRIAGSDDLNRAVLDSLPSHVAVLDPSGTIIATNRAWRKFQEENGGTAATCDVGCNYLNVCRGATGDQLDVACHVLIGIEAVLRGEREDFSIEYPCPTPTVDRWFLLNARPLISSQTGERLGAVVAHLNITQRKLNEENIRQRVIELAQLTHQLKRTNEELDQFAYITSHDLRAPLRGIANLSRWIEEDMGDRFTPEAHQQMELLRGRVHRMEAMIDGILEYSRVGRVKLKIEPVDVGGLLKEVIDLLDPPKHIEVEVEAGMPLVHGHKLQLQQVFQNLIGNAIKYHDKPSGRIVVGCRADGEETYEFSVSDDGPGIEPQYHDKIFVIFQTLQPRDKVEGTGVGLSLVRKIVESEGGTVRLESEPGKGSTFRFTWPRTPNLGRAADAADER